MRFWTSVRCMPQAARLRCASVNGVTRISPSPTSYFTRSSSTCIASCPLGPFTVKVPLSRAAVTPAGRAIGFLPMRDILEHLRQHFAADVLLARLGVRQHTARGRHDDRAEAVADARKLASGRIDPAAGLRHSSQVLDCRLALEIFELDPQALLARELFLGISADIAFALEHIENSRAQLRGRRQDAVLPGLLAVADAGEQVTQGIGHRHP